MGKGKYNQQLQVDAIRLLKPEIKENYLFVFLKYKDLGKDYLAHIEAQLEEMKVSYLILDNLTQESMWSVFKKASVAIMTPVSDGTPNTALEAMSARCPLILGNLNYDKDLFEGVSFKLKEDSPEALCQQIEQAITAYPPTLIEEGFARVSKLGNRHVEMEKIHAIYRSV